MLVKCFPWVIFPLRGKLKTKIYATQISIQTFSNENSLQVSMVEPELIWWNLIINAIFNVWQCVCVCYTCMCFWYFKCNVLIYEKHFDSNQLKLNIYFLIVNNACKFCNLWNRTCNYFTVFWCESWLIVYCQIWSIYNTESWSIFCYQFFS